MSDCSHKTLILLKESGEKLRCTKCHLVLSPDELHGGCCPECYEVNGVRCMDFEPVVSEDDAVTRYRCEGCGIIIEWKG